MTTPNRNRTKWHLHYNTCFSKSSNMDHLSELSNWSSTIAAPVQLTKRSTSLLSSSSTNSSHVFLVQYCPMGPFACPIGKLKLDAWFEKIQDKWHGVGVGVGVNNMEKKKKYKSTAFSLESCIKDIEVHIPMYLRTANDLFRSTQKKNTDIDTDIDKWFEHWTFILSSFETKAKKRQYEESCGSECAALCVVLASL